MTAPATSVHRWSPTSGTGADVLELAHRAESLDTLCSALAGVAPHLNACALVLARISVPSSADLMAAMAAAHGMNLPVRVCLAIDRQLLRKVVTPIRNVDRIGLLLDDVDARTPLADVAYEALEAVRFDPEFARGAAGHLRTQCVLDALLGFARDSGLCTFGPARRGDAWEGSVKQFDYIASA